MADSRAHLKSVKCTPVALAQRKRPENRYSRALFRSFPAFACNTGPVRTYVPEELTKPVATFAAHHRTVGVVARKTDLYFILNPVVGIIKIGISEDVEQRCAELERSSGIPLRVLKVVAGAGGLEDLLHLAFLPTRLIGEWFGPSEELLGLIEGDESIHAFVARKADVIAEHLRATEENTARRYAAQRVAEKTDRDEARRLKAEMAARIEAARLARQAARDADDDALLAHFAARRDASRGEDQERFARIYDKKALEIAAGRAGRVAHLVPKRMSA